MKKTITCLLSSALLMSGAQAQTVIGDPWDGDFSATAGTENDGNMTIGQSITPPSNGYITAITFWYVAVNPQSGDGTHTAQLFFGLNPASGTLSTAIDTFEFPTGLTLFDMSTYTYTFANPIPLTGGTTYRFEIHNTAGEDNYALWTDIDGPPDPYPGGRAYHNGDSTYLGDSNLFFTYTLSTTPLPVRLSAFDVQPLGDAALLSWTTDMEQHNKGFAIEHSADGHQWQALAFAPSQHPEGNSTVRLQYSYTDQQLASGLHYYRLKQTDYDGAFNYSQIKTIRVETGGAQLSVHPNPVSNTVYLNGLTDGAHIRVINAAGITVADYAATATSMQLDAAAWSAGLYLIQVYTAGEPLWSQKIIKQ